MNGVVMKMHPVNVGEDGIVLSVGKLWQLKGWLEDEKVEFKECPSREVMEFARSVIWSKATDERMVEWTAQMDGLGYTGSAKDPMKRGVEGCMAGSMDAGAGYKNKEQREGGSEDTKTKDARELKQLNDLIGKWREPGLHKIPPRLVIPDFSNRGHTGLSVEHVHYLASRFKEQGFKRRVGNTGHDIPVLIRDTPTSELGQKAIQNWRGKLDSDEKGFPPRAHYERCFRGGEIFTSLGNGHFNQALNLFLNECDSIYPDKPPYTIGTDAALREAVSLGPDALVLKNGIPLDERMIISRLLNSKREFKWNVGPDGSLRIDDAVEDTSHCTQFEAMSKVLDAVELDCLVRAELKVTDSERVGK